MKAIKEKFVACWYWLVDCSRGIATIVSLVSFHCLFRTLFFILFFLSPHTFYRCVVHGDGDEGYPKLREFFGGLPTVIVIKCWILAFRYEWTPHREELEEIIIKHGDMAVKPLIKALKLKSKYKRGEAYPLSEHPYKNDLIRIGAAKALGRIKDKRAVKPLIRALRDEDFSVRRVAAEALGEFIDKRAVKPLIKALRDEDQFVRLIAEEALGKIQV